MLKKYKQLLIHIFLFLLTFATTTLAGADWKGEYANSMWDYIWSGLNFSITFLGVLTIHEFGHYYFAKKYNLDVSLPYYIPFYFPGTPSIGTFGAFIRMKGQIQSRTSIFDIGIAGPLAGFAAAFLLLIYGFATLPEKEYIYRIHPDYEQFKGDYANHVYTYDYMKSQSDAYVNKKFIEDSIYYVEHIKTETDLVKPERVYETSFSVLTVGDNLLMLFFKKLFSYQGDKIPNQYEFFHYPYLFAAYLALFFTALNLIPVGQLDGGHVIYGLFGHSTHKKIAGTFFTGFVTLAGIGLFQQNPADINFFTADALDKIQFVLLYLGFLYLVFSRMYENYMNAILAAVAVFTIQLLIEFIFPDVTGYNGWLLYAFLIGRFLGVYHPPSIDERPLDLKRKLLGWFAVLVFIVCFTPEVITFQEIAR
ncbi:site-2 protease family protein [Cytophaga aurantiaca]|uniref:site-2 protease family protein n=1 Tax=Cytophaga aurantiaca TaxID=29530 RepID=UPI0003636414|nr:site-2 protease family protein [Cytophaga aurantiaca]